MGVLEGRHHAPRLVQRDIVTFTRQTNGLTIEGHAIGVQIDFGSEFSHDLAIDLDAPLCDPRFTRAARADPGGGERFLKPF